MERNKQVGYADVDNCYREIEELKAENEKLKIENEKLKADNERMFNQLDEIICRYDMAMTEERPFVLLPHLAKL